MSLYLELRNKYGLNNPFLLEEISTKENYDVVKTTLSRLVKSNKIRRYSNGVYYLPKNSILGELYPNYGEVLKKKYLENNGNTFGYYTGYTLLNMVGLTTQVSNIREICTNEETNIKRTTKVSNMNVILRKPLCEITNENVRYLQFIDIFRYCDLFALLENKDGVKEFINENNLKRKEIMPYLDLAPHRAVDYMFGSGMFNELKW